MHDDQSTETKVAGVFVAVAVADAVDVRVAVLVIVGVDVTVGVMVTVLVRVEVFVIVGVLVAVLVIVGVSVIVGVLDTVYVTVGVRVIEGVPVGGQTIAGRNSSLQQPIFEYGHGGLHCALLSPTNISNTSPATTSQPRAAKMHHTKILAISCLMAGR